MNSLNKINQDLIITSNSQEHEHSGLSVGQGQSRVGNEPSVITTTAIVERKVQDAGKVKRDIKSFKDFLLQNINSFTGRGLPIGSFYANYANLHDIQIEEAKDKENAETKFKEWFGISYKQYVGLLTTNEAWNTLTESQIADFLNAIDNIEETAVLLLSKTNNHSNDNRIVTRFLRDLESFLRSSNKVDQGAVHNLQGLLDFKVEAKALNQKLGQLLEAYKTHFPEKTIKKIAYTGRNAHLIAREPKRPLKELSEEEKFQQKFKNSVNFIASVLSNCSTEAHFALFNVEIDFLLSLDINTLDEGRKSIVAQTKDCILAAANHYVNAKDKANLALGLKLQKIIAPELYKQTLEKKYQVLINDLEYNVYSTGDVDVLTDIRAIKGNSLSELQTIAIECSTSDSFERNDQKVTQLLFDTVSKHSEFENVAEIIIKGKHIGNLTITSLPKIESVEIGSVKGDLTFERSSELQQIVVHSSIEGRLFLEVQPKLELIKIYNSVLGLSIPTMPELNLVVVSSPHGDISIKSQPKLAEIHLGYSYGSVNLTIETPQPENQDIKSDSRMQDKITIVRVAKPAEKEVVSDAVQQKERIVVQKESNPESKFVTVIVAIGISFLGYGFVRMFLMSWANPIVGALVFGSIGAVAYSKLSQRQVSHIA